MFIARTILRVTKKSRDNNVIVIGSVRAMASLSSIVLNTFNTVTTTRSPSSRSSPSSAYAAHAAHAAHERTRTERVFPMIRKSFYSANTTNDDSGFADFTDFNKASSSSTTLREEKKTESFDSTARDGNGNGGTKTKQQQQQQQQKQFFCLCSEVAKMAKIRRTSGEEHCVYKEVVVGDIIKAKQGITLAKRAHWTTLDTGVDDAVRKMYALDVGALVVMDFHKLDIDKSKKIHLEELYYSPRSEAIAGIITERDYLRAVAKNKIGDLTTVREIMTPAFDLETQKKKLISVDPMTSVLVAMHAMTEGHFRHIPVIDEEKMTLEGVVSLGDVVKALIAEQHDEINVLEEYIQNT
jgi:CBS domain-containing protein